MIDRRRYPLGIIARETGFRDRDDLRQAFAPAYWHLPAGLPAGRSGWRSCLVISPLETGRLSWTFAHLWGNGRRRAFCVGRSRTRHILGAIYVSREGLPRILELFPFAYIRGLRLPRRGDSAARDIGSNTRTVSDSRLPGEQMQDKKNTTRDTELEFDGKEDLRRGQLSNPDGTARNDRRQRLWRALFGVVGAVVFLGGIVVADPPYMWREFGALSRSSTWELPDGSAVVMNRDSRAIVSFHLRSRRIELTQGQARFQVAHSWVRTFEVRSGDAKIEAISATFHVRRFPNSVRVTVAEGHVRVSDRTGIRELGENEGGDFSR